MSDSPKLHTGFARVAKEIWTYLTRTGKYDVRCIGWFHQDTNEECIYPIYTTAKDDNGKIIQEDKYAHKTFPQYVDQFKPDLVWTLGDMWMVDHVASAKNRDTFKWIGYFPIDGHPSPSKWGKVIDNMDVAVAYGKYGMDVIKQRAPNANLRYIYHGVNCNMFKPVSDSDRIVARKDIIGVSDDRTIIGIISRNQPRKAFDKLFEAFYYILNGTYNRCNSCKKITVDDYDLITHKNTDRGYCAYCGCEDVERGKSRDDVRLYIHGAVVDCGWDLLDLQKDYDLAGKVLVNPTLKVGVGVSDHTLNGVYNAIDIFTLPSRGEGFGLPILEAMSVGKPIVVTDYSAYPEWASGAGELVPYAALEAEPLTNIRRAVIDVNEYVNSLLKLIDNKALREEYGARGRKIAESMSWGTICKKWEALVDSILFPSGNAPTKIELSDLKYSLEEM